MTRYTGNEPIEPFHVMAKTVKLKCSVEKDEPASGGGAKIPSAKRSALWQDLDSTTEKIVVAVLLAGVFIVATNQPAFAAVAILILPGVALYRLDSRRRQIAAAPVIFAAMMLASKIGARSSWYMNYGATGYGATPSVADVNELKIWMPLLLAGCLFYMPKFPTYTEKILLSLSLILLLSGLLPGDGFGIRIPDHTVLPVHCHRRRVGN